LLLNFAKRAYKLVEEFFCETNSERIGP